MKKNKIRRNVDLSRKAIAVFQWQAVINGHGTVKPYLEAHLEKHASRVLSKNPALNKVLSKKVLK